MTMDGIGQLTLLDEFLDHQIADTFATIVESDIGWTEKVWGAFARKDGALSISFGLGKYHNRNVMDGFGGISRGAEQWTVRASRRLDSGLQDMGVGPVRYEVVEPLQKVRFSLAPNDTQPIAFDILFEGELPPFFEKRNVRRNANRTAMNVVRYHQAGKVSGWVEIDGRREVVDEAWFGFRDHSWGMRGSAVGAPIPDLQPGQSMHGNSRISWGPWLLTRPDGSKYEVMHFFSAGEYWQYFSAHLNEGGSVKADGRQTEFRGLSPDIRLDPITRRFLGGTYTVLLADGETRQIEVMPAGPSGFYLRTGDYGGWKGGRQGSWRGDYHEDGEYFADVAAEIHQLGQFRDCPVIVRDGEAVGFGIQETIYQGVYPELGLTEDSDHPTA